MRLKLQQKKEAEMEEKKAYKGVVHGIQKIAKEEGVSALWSGATASLWLVSNPTLLFVLYNSLRKALIRVRKTNNLSALEFFLLGAISKSISTVLTYPIQLAQYRMRTKKEDSSSQKERFSNLFSCLIYIVKNDGPLGLFHGLNVKLLQTVLMSAFHFLCYEKIMTIIYALLGVKK
jgi:adenine nucleotide transporter 17